LAATRAYIVRTSKLGARGNDSFAFDQLRLPKLGRHVSKNSLRIATWNIASSRNHAAIASRIAKLDLDICAMQEVWLDCTADLPAILNSASPDLNGYCWYFASALSPHQLDSRKAEYFGLAIMSKIAFTHVASFQLDPNYDDRGMSAEAEPRILQLAIPQRGLWDRPFVLGNTHLAATEGWSLSPRRRSQASRIADILRSIATPGPMILGGDFNTGPFSSDLTELQGVLPYAYASSGGTYIGEPGPPVDFFCSSSALAVDISVFEPAGLSDHNIVVATLRDERPHAIQRLSSHAGSSA
jgi:endonuclease/exonuclease/phosphatase family metal-dependent hydrolase